MPGVSVQPPRGKTELASLWELNVGEYVTDATLSHDGTLAAIAAGDGDVIAIDTATGRARWRQPAHAGGALALAFSPRQTLLATGGQDGRARLFDENGRAMAELPGSGGWVDHVAWSPDGTLLATSSGRSLRLWTRTGEPRLETEPHPSTVAGIAWRRDSREVATCSYGGVHLWTVESGARARHFAWKGSLVSIAWSPDGKVIACGSQDSSVHFWRLPSGNDSEMRGYPFKPKALAWDASSSMLATGGDATVTIWKFAGKGPEGKPPKELKGHKALCTALAFAPRSGRLASGARDTGVLLWEPGRASVPTSYAFLRDEITALAWHPEGRSLLASDAAGNVGFFATA
jgi:WD40 repeat protein